jgi:hypothetical protein
MSKSPSPSPTATISPAEAEPITPAPEFPEQMDLVFEDIILAVPRALLVQSFLFEPFVQLAELDDSLEPDQRWRIDVPSKQDCVVDLLTLAIELENTEDDGAIAAVPLVKLVALAECSDHFGFQELTDRLLCYMAQHIAAAQPSLCAALGVDDSDMTPEERRELRRQCNLVS